MHQSFNGICLPKFIPQFFVVVPCITKGGNCAECYSKYFFHYRNHDSAKGEIKHEREANAFAAALLMPRERIITELEKMPFDLADGDENAVKALADKFMVSTQAMLVRVSNLNLF